MSSYSTGVVVPVNTSRGRGHLKNNIEKLNSLEVKSLRRPMIQNLIPGDNVNNNISNSSSCSKQEIANECNKDSSGLDAEDKLKNNFSKLSVTPVVTANKDFNNSESLKGLNPYAEEFVPSTKKPYQIEVIDPNTGCPVLLKRSSQQEMLSYDICSFDYDGTNLDLVKVAKAISSVTPISNSELQSSGIHPVKEVNDVLDVVESLLIRNPGLYTAVIMTMTGIFERWSCCEQTLIAVASKIMKQSVTTNNYSYICAKMCTELDKIPLSVGIHRRFRNYILTECEQEYSNLEDRIKSENYLHVYRVITFFAELYIQLVINEQSRIKMLGESLINSLNILLAVCKESNVCCVCKVLKLSGWALFEDHPVKMKQLLDSLLKIRNSNNLDVSAANMLNSVITLANDQWGRSSNVCVVSPSRLNAVTADNNNRGDSNTNDYQRLKPTDQFNSAEYQFPNETNYVYENESVVLSEEELKFFNEMCKSDDEFSDYDCDTDDGVISDMNMDDEACEAYEQFLLTVPKSNYNAVSNTKK